MHVIAILLSTFDRGTELDRVFQLTGSIPFFDHVHFEVLVLRGVKHGHNTMNLCGDTLWHFVVLQGQTNFVLIFRVEQVHVKCQ